MSVIKGTNLVIRFLLELCALPALGYWGSRSVAAPMPGRTRSARPAFTLTLGALRSAGGVQ